MAVNKVTITINSRQYTVVAEESTEYLEQLCSHINEKVENVIRGGQNLLGERPVVLAALNICDEYYKSVEECEKVKGQLQKFADRNTRLNYDMKGLQSEADMLRSGQMSIDEEAVKAEAKAAKDDLADANNQIKFLEGHITILENKLKDMEEKYKEREKEMLEMIEKG